MQQRQASSHTVLAYRNTFRLLLAFFDLGGEEHRVGTGCLIFRKKELNATTRQVVREAAISSGFARYGGVFFLNVIRQLIAQCLDLSFDLGFVELLDLIDVLFTAGRELLNLFSRSSSSSIWVQLSR